MSCNFSQIVIFARGQHADTIRDRLKEYGNFDVEENRHPKINGALFSLEPEYEGCHRDYGFLTQCLFTGIPSEEFLLLAQHTSEPKNNLVLGMCWDNPYKLDFICERYIHIAAV